MIEVLPVALLKPYKPFSFRLLDLLEQKLGKFRGHCSNFTNFSLRLEITVDFFTSHSILVVTAPVEPWCKLDRARSNSVLRASRLASAHSAQLPHCVKRTWLSMTSERAQGHSAACSALDGSERAIHQQVSQPKNPLRAAARPHLLPVGQLSNSNKGIRY